MEEKNKIKQKQMVLMFIGIAILVVSITGITFAFFNYTKTGGANVIKTGNIEFNMTQGKTINLQNVFPITSAEALAYNSNTSVCEIVITGRNTYAGGVEYLVSTVNATNTDVPVNILVSVENNGNGANDNLGTSDNNYFANRNSYTTSHYKKLVGDSFTGNEDILVGYIASSASTDNSINGKITIRAYFDRDTIAITDTPSENMTWQEERTVMSTTEWNALNSAGISFQVRVEANEGKWVTEPPMPLGEKVISRLGNDGVVAIKTDGTLYSGSGDIREYRYSGGGRYCTYENGGTTYNLQIEGNTCPETVVYGEAFPGLFTPTTDTAAYQDTPNGTTYTLVSGTGINEGTVKNYIMFNGELWRIIGVFDDKLKIMKDVPIKTSDSYMADDGTNGVKYTALNNVTYQIKPYFASGPMSNAKYAPIVWNSQNKNDWATSGLLYWLNENNNGSYYNTMLASYKSLLLDNTYYLNNINVSSYGTASEVYNEERVTAVECDASVTSNSHSNSCNVWNGNSSEWTGKIALPYPSDFGYAASTSYWTTSIGSYWNPTNPAIQSDNWFLNNDAFYIWFLSPSSSNTRYVCVLNNTGFVYEVNNPEAHRNFAVRPVLNINANTLTTGGDGSYSNPYTLKID